MKTFSPDTIPNHLYDSSREKKRIEKGVEVFDSPNAFRSKQEHVRLRAILEEKENILSELQSEYFLMKEKTEQLHQKIFEAKHEVQVAEAAVHDAEETLSEADRRSVQLGMAETNHKKNNIPTVYSDEDIIKKLEETTRGARMLKSAEDNEAFLKHIPLGVKIFGSPVKQLYREKIIEMARSEKELLSNDRMGRVKLLEQKQKEFAEAKGKLHKLYIDFGQEMHIEDEKHRAIEQQKLAIKNTEAEIRKLEQDEVMRRSIEQN